MDLTEENLKAELDNALQDSRQSGKSGQLSRHLETTIEAQEDTDASNSDLLDKLENKKKELVCCLFIFFWMFFIHLLSSIPFFIFVKFFIFSC